MSDTIEARELKLDMAIKHCGLVVTVIGLRYVTESLAMYKPIEVTAINVHTKMVWYEQTHGKVELAR